MEPFVTHYEHSLFNGTYVGVALLNWLSHMNSPIRVGIEGMIHELDKKTS